MVSEPKQNHEKSLSEAPALSNPSEDDERTHSVTLSENAISVPDSVAGSSSLERLADKARDYAAQATAENTNLAYASDWAHFASWCRRRGAELLPPSPALIGLYITECASPQETPRRSTANFGTPSSTGENLSVSTIERRLSGLAWHYQQRGFTLDRRDRHISTVLAGIRRKHAKPPAQKEALMAEDILEMISILSFGLRDLRDRAILLIGYAGGLRRSEIVGLDIGKDDSQGPDDDSGGFIEIAENGVILFIKGKTGWREVEIGRGSSDQTCPVHALEQWLHFAKIAKGPIFRPVTRDNAKVTADRLSDKHVARLIKKTALEVGLRPDLPDAEREKLFSGHSLRAGLASSAEVDERYIQKQLGHVSAEMTRRYQRRRDRFRVNLTKAAGL
ncbi:MAG: tyrosine-type recombinase/integrase [Salaquimonas sp.]